METLYTVSKKRPGADCSSDHELLIANFRLKLKNVGNTTRPFTYDQGSPHSAGSRYLMESKDQKCISGPAQFKRVYNENYRTLQNELKKT